MLLTHVTLEPGQLEALRGGDLAALEQVFRANYPHMVKEAPEESGDAAAAPHVIERAFVRLWSERSTIASSEALDTFLSQAVHAGLVRERSRRAAIHRLEENVHARVTPGAAPPSADDAWARVAAGIAQQAAPPPASHGREIAAHSRHATAEHMANLTARRTMFDWRKLAGSIVAIGAVIGLLTWLGRGAADDIVDQTIAAADSRVIATKPAERAQTTLGDGTVAALGADTRLRRPTGFGRTIRALGLEGTARFTVPAGTDDPLDVRARNVSITSPGGVFVVRAYSTDSAVAVAAREGSVTVRAGGTARPLAPGSAVSVARDGTMSDLVAPALDEQLAWADGRLVLSGRRLREALPEMRRWYLLDLYLNDSSLDARPVTMSADLTSSVQALSELEKSAGVRLTYEGKTMVLRDARAGGATRR
jgi:ferric-dicitrate binding protein FerR (iron transport regulator)